MYENELKQAAFILNNPSTKLTLNDLKQKLLQILNEIDIFCQYFIRMFNIDFENCSLSKEAKNYYNKKLDIYSKVTKMLAIIKMKEANAN
jgi:hypothetical protein